MNKIFDMDNPIWRMLGRLADLMLLNIIFIICSLPIFTIGASLTAMSYVTLKIHEGEEGYITKSFFRSFKQNFKQATAIWILMLFLGILLVIDMLILQNMEGTMTGILSIVIMALAIVYLMVLIYVFPILSRFFNTVKTTIKNAFIMAIADFPKTLVMVILVIASGVCTMINAYTLMWGLLIWILAGFALISYINSYFLKGIFKKYMPEEEEEKDPDSWDIDRTMEALEPVDPVKSEKGSAQ